MLSTEKGMITGYLAHFVPLLAIFERLRNNDSVTIYRIRFRLGNVLQVDRRKEKYVSFRESGFTAMRGIAIHKQFLANRALYLAIPPPYRAFGMTSNCPPSTVHRTGELDGIRTHDPLIKSQMLYR